MSTHPIDVSEEADAIRNYFVDLGLDLDTAELYLVLRNHGPQNLLQLSRISGVERRRIYRLLDGLSGSGLIEIEEHYKRKLYKAAPIANLQIILAKREQELLTLQEKFKMLDAFLSSAPNGDKSTRVQFYKGTDGIKQMMWNQTKSNTENLAILYENMQGRTNSAFFDRWVQRSNDRNINFRGLIGDHFIKTQQEWYKTHDNIRLKNWKSRYLDRSVLNITHSMIVYDDVLSFYNWVDNEVFGVELYNSEIANHQRQLFEILWEKSQPIDDLVGLKSTSKS